jgi:hypothetical protein
MGEININEERNLCDFSTNIVSTANDDHAASPLNIEWLSTFLLNFKYVHSNGCGCNRRVFNSALAANQMASAMGEGWALLEGGKTK